jgi:deoxyribonuclease V
MRPTLRAAGDTGLVSFDGWRRFAAVDVHYPAGGGACAALVVAADAGFGGVLDERVTWLDTVAPYQPGRFYLRELPAIEAVLATTDPVDLLIIDGYVDLDPDARPGLGAHVRERIGVPVIGVAKTAFQPATQAVPVRRGSSTKPLYVTAAGLPIAQAADLVAAMAGRHRMPDALRRVDDLCRRPPVPPGIID